MVPRRSLTSALEITADQLAFIHSRPASPTTSGSPAPPLRISTVGAAPDENLAPAASETPPEPRPAVFRDRRPEVATEADPPSLLGEVLVPVTTRIRPATANALRRAYLEQKLAHRTPATQQEIIEEALVAWLEQHGHR